MKKIILILSVILTNPLLFSQQNNVNAEKTKTTKTIEERAHNKIIALESVIGLISVEQNFHLEKIYTELYKTLSTNKLKPEAVDSIRLQLGTKAFGLLNTEQKIALQKHLNQRFEENKHFLELNPENPWAKRNINYDITTL